MELIHDGTQGGMRNWAGKEIFHNDARMGLVTLRHSLLGLPRRRSGK